MRLSMLTGCVVVILGAAVFLGPPRETRAEGQLQTVRFAIHGPSGERQSALAVWPTERAKDERWPIVIAFHGMGESRQGPEKGYRAWLERYGLGPAFEALLGNNLTKDDFGGLVRDEELRALNGELKARPFRGVFVVGIYTPDLLAQVDHPEKIEAFASWVAKRLVPKVRDTFPVASQTEREVSVDGVSLGGMVALEVGLRHPEVFGAVGTIQPAIRGREAEFADRAAKASAQKSQALRLLSSDKDPLLPVTRKFSEELRARHVAHTLIVTPGEHDYAFNQGPGAIELLRFSDRALRDLRSR
ncbi:MAG: alpha/beta hydrolase-fold protein [Myxococcales bacterium]